MPSTTASIVYTSTNVHNGYWISTSEHGSSAGTGFVISSPMVSGSGVEVSDTEPSGHNLKPTRGIHPKLIFKYTKSKLTKPDLDMLKINLAKLKPMIISADIMGQRVLFEELSQQLAVVVKEQEALAIGCGHRLPRDIAKKYAEKSRDKVVRFELLEKFPRMIPETVRSRITQVKDTCVFDEYWVLFIDESKQALKTTKDKIKEKDPILFGVFKFQPDVLYYITDWIDEYCDLTMSKLVGEIKLDDPEFALDRVPMASQEYVDDIVKAVQERASRLDKTQRSNFNELAANEDSDFANRNKPKKKSEEKSLGKRLVEKVGDILGGKKEKPSAR